MKRLRAPFLCWLVGHAPVQLFLRDRKAVVEWRCRRCNGYFFSHSQQELAAMQLGRTRLDKYARAKGGRAL